MAEDLVAADASPLIGLAAAGAFDLLRQLFGTVTVTAAVRAEVMAGGDLPGARELAAAIAAGWISVTPTPGGTDEFPELDAGEASTLLFAMQTGPRSLVLMDEKLGRAQAGVRGIAVTGLAGVLLAAKEGGLIPQVRPFLNSLAQSDFRISGKIADALLQEAGEAPASRV